MIGLASFVNKQYPAPLPADATRAKFVMSKIDDILARERDADNDRDIRFVDLGQYLCEVRAGQYWRFERLKSFDEVGKPFVVEREAVLYLRCERHELASDLKEEALKILELTNRLFEERIVISDTPPTPTSWIAISDEQGQIVSDTPAHDCHFG